jgi:hypothetical protein
VDIHHIFPTVVFIVIAFPLDKVLKLSPEHPAIKYSFDFVVFLSINQDRIWWRITPLSWCKVIPILSDQTEQYLCLLFK